MEHHHVSWSVTSFSHALPCTSVLIISPSAMLSILAALPGHCKWLLFGLDLLFAIVVTEFLHGRGCCGQKPWQHCLSCQHDSRLFAIFLYSEAQLGIQAHYGVCCCAFLALISTG